MSFAGLARFIRLSLLDRKPRQVTGEIAKISLDESQTCTIVVK